MFQIHALQLVHVSDPYVTTGPISVLYICILTDLFIILLFSLWWLAAYALFPVRILSFTHSLILPSFIYYIAKIYEAGHAFKYFISYFPILSLSSLLSYRQKCIKSFSYSPLIHLLGFIFYFSIYTYLLLSNSEFVVPSELQTEMY